MIDNWIMKVTPYRVYVAHKSVLIVNKTDTHQMSRDEVQYINIEVRLNFLSYSFVCLLAPELMKF